MFVDCTSPVNGIFPSKNCSYLCNSTFACPTPENDPNNFTATCQSDAQWSYKREDAVCVPGKHGFTGIFGRVSYMV